MNSSTTMPAAPISARRQRERNTVDDEAST